MYKYSASILVLTYNHSEFIVEALTSIENQNFDSVQVVVGDDASTDNTIDLVLNFSLKSKYDYVKIFNKKNIGITGNFNNCLDACEGKYIFLLGGDDLFLMGKLKLQFDYMEMNPEVFISYHDSEVFDSLTGNKINNYNEFFNINDISVKSLVEYGTFFTGCSVAVRNFQGLPRCNSKIKHASDWLWYIDILMLSKGRLGFLDNVLSKYRRHKNNVTSSDNIMQSYNETIISLNIIENKYISLNRVARRAIGERMFAFGIKFLLLMRFKTGFLLLAKSLLLSPFSLYRFLKLRMNFIMKRIKRIYSK